MDEETLKRLRNLLGENDVWEEPKTSVDPPPTMAASDAPDFSHGYESDMEEGTYDYNNGGAQNPSHKQQRPSRRGKKTGRGAMASSSSTPAPAARHLPPLEELEKHQFPAFVGEQGDMSPMDMTFTSLTMANNYPIQYIGNANRGKASPFFRRGALLDRMEWDFFYIWHPQEANRYVHHPAMCTMASS